MLDLAQTQVLKIKFIPQEVHKLTRTKKWVTSPIENGEDYGSWWRKEKTSVLGVEYWDFAGYLQRCDFEWATESSLQGSVTVDKEIILL